MGWIKCSERLPEEGQKIIIFMPNFINGSWTETAFFGSNGSWCLSASILSIEKTKITHWMPLPDPPEEGG